MPRLRRTAVAASLLSVCSITAVAFASSPAKNATFKGTATGSVKFATTFLAKVPLTFKTSHTGKELTGFNYTDTVCGLAASKKVALGAVKVANGKPSVSGHKSPAVPDALADGNTVVTTTSLTGHFVSTKKLAGTLTYAQHESGTPGASCGPIKLSFTASTR